MFGGIPEAPKNPSRRTTEGIKEGSQRAISEESLLICSLNSI